MSINIANKFTLRAARKSDEVLEPYESKGSRTIPRRERESNLSDLVNDKSMEKLSKRMLTDICKAFCNTIEQHKYYVAIYTNVNWLENHLYKDELLPTYDLWLADWNEDKPSYSCGLWQFSNKGCVYGVNGDVDMNLSYKNYPKVIKSKGLNGFTAHTNYFTYTVKRGDTLWNLSKIFLGNGTKYKEIKKLNNLTQDTIYVGQILKIPK